MVATYVIKDHAQYDLCDWYVFKGDNYHVFGLSSVLACRKLTFGFADTINVMCQTLHDLTTQAASETLPLPVAF